MTKDVTDRERIAVLETIVAALLRALIEVREGDYTHAADQMLLDAQEHLHSIQDASEIKIAFDALTRS